MLHLTPVHRFSHFFKVSRAVAKFSVGAPEKKLLFLFSFLQGKKLIKGSTSRRKIHRFWQWFPMTSCVRTLRRKEDSVWLWDSKPTSVVSNCHTRSGVLIPGFVFFVLKIL